MAKRAVPRLFRYAVFNSVTSFFVTLIVANFFTFSYDMGGEGKSLANLVILAFSIFFTLGNLTYLLIPIKRIPIVNLLFAFTWFSLLSFTWIYFSPDGANINDHRIKNVLIFYTIINMVLGIASAFWYHRIIIKILGPDPNDASFSMHFLGKIVPNKNKYLLDPLIEGAKSAGLDAKDIKIVEKFLDQHEMDKCYTYILKQLQEQNVPISKTYYNVIMKAGNELKIPAERYSQMEALIHNP